MSVRRDRPRTCAGVTRLQRRRQQSRALGGGAAHVTVGSLITACARPSPTPAPGLHILGLAATGHHSGPPPTHTSQFYAQPPPPPSAPPNTARPLPGQLIGVTTCPVGGDTTSGEKRPTVTRPASVLRRQTEPNPLVRRKNGIPVKKKGVAVISLVQTQRPHTTLSRGRRTMETPATDTLSIQLKVSELDVDRPDPGQTWLETFHKKVLKLYACILREEQVFLEALARLPCLTGVTPLQLTIGSVMVKVRCHNLQALEQLEESSHSSSLGHQLSCALITPEILNEVGVKRILFEAEINKTEVDKCREFFSQQLEVQSDASGASLGSTGPERGCSPAGDMGSTGSLDKGGILHGTKAKIGPSKKPALRSVSGLRKSSLGVTRKGSGDSKLKHKAKKVENDQNTNHLNGESKSRSSSFDLDRPRKNSKDSDKAVFVKEVEFWSRKDCVRKVSEVLEDFRMNIEIINERHVELHGNFQEFLAALKLSKPRQLETYSNLQDVITCHKFLNTSLSVGKSVRTDLVTDFLRIPNLARIHVNTVTSGMNEALKHIPKYVKPSRMSGYVDELRRVKEILEPDTAFLSLPAHSEVELGVMEKKLFPGLVRYVPALLVRLGKLADALDKLMNLLDFEEGDSMVGEFEDTELYDMDEVDSAVSRMQIEKALEMYCEEDK